jgi:transcription initiation factor TFIIB
MAYDHLFSMFDTLRMKEEVPTEYNQHTCKNCIETTLSIDSSNGVVVCTSCGMVNENFLIDETAEWNFGADEAMFSKDPSRCGGPVNTLLQKSSMSTMINTSRSKGNNFTMARIHQQQSMDHKERSLYHVFEQIYKMGHEKGNLATTIIEQAKAFYKTMSEKRLSRGSIRKGLIACCIMYACKVNNVPRSIKEIASMCSLDVSIINKTSKIFLEIMGGDMNIHNAGINVDDLISRFCNVFQFETKEHHGILRVVRKVYEHVMMDNILGGKTPTSMASGIIYYVLITKGYAIDKKFISEKHKISIVTLNKMHTILQESEAVRDIIQTSR